MKKFVLLLFSAASLLSCNTDELDFDNIKLQPVTGTFGFPLGESSYVLRDLLEKQTGDSLGFVEDTTGLFTLQYFDTIRFNAPNDFITIGDQVFNGELAAPNLGTLTSDQTVQFTNDFIFQYQPDEGESVDSLFYGTGEIRVDVSSSLTGDTDYTLTFFSTENINSGAPLVITGNLNGQGTAPQEVISLEGYRTVLRNTGTSNEFEINLLVESFYRTGDIVDNSQTITFDITYQNQTFRVIYGKFGQDTIQVGNQAIELDFFSQNNRGGVTFGDPSINFQFHNTFGVPLAVDFRGISATDAQNIKTNLAGNITRNRQLIAGSDPFTASSAAPGEIAQTDIEINKFNSSIINLLSKNPAELAFDIKALANTPATSSVNYVHQDSEIEAYISMDLPLTLQLKDLQETGTYGLGDGIDLANVDSAFIRVVTLNELPFSGKLRLDIMGIDSVSNDTTALYTAADNLIINAPFINSQGEVTDPGGASADVPIGEAGVRALESASFVQITLTLNTPASQTSRQIYVKIRGDYSLVVTLGLGGTFNLEIE